MTASGKKSSARKSKRRSMSKDDKAIEVLQSAHELSMACQQAGLDEDAHIGYSGAMVQYAYTCLGCNQLHHNILLYDDEKKIGLNVLVSPQFLESMKALIRNVEEKGRGASDYFV